MGTETMEMNGEQKSEEVLNSENGMGNSAEGSSSDPGSETGSEQQSGSGSQNRELTKEEILELELKKALDEVANFRESWQRERAEFVNYKKRTAMELLNSRKEAVRNFIHDLLHPMDNLGMVTRVNTDNAELKAFVTGVDMVVKEFQGIMEREGVLKLHPINQSFDPMTMEAIASEESDAYSEETVVEVFQPGYYYMDGEHKHSIRPARVKVGKPKAQELLGD